jgi:hypothetical protein
MDIFNISKSLLTLKLWIILLLCCLLVACNSTSKVEATFIGIIEEINGKSALINVEQTSGTKIGGVVSIGIPEDSTETFRIGDKVEVGFDGTTFEIAPVLVQTITLEKIE